MTQPRYGGSSGTGRRMQVDSEVLDRMVSKRKRDDALIGGAAGAAGGGAVAAAAGGAYGARYARDPWAASMYPKGKVPTKEVLRAAGRGAAIGSRSGAVLGAAGGVAGGLAVGRSRDNRRRVTKRVRDYDSEDRRQRRLGMAQAATAGAGIAGLAVGGRGVLRSTRAARKVGGLNGTDKDAINLLRTAHQTGVVAQRRDLAALGGGLTGVAATGAIRQHAENPKNRRYL